MQLLLGTWGGTLPCTLLESNRSVLILNDRAAGVCETVAPWGHIGVKVPDPIPTATCGYAVKASACLCRTNDLENCTSECIENMDAVRENIGFCWSNLIFNPKLDSCCGWGRENCPYYVHLLYGHPCKRYTDATWISTKLSSFHFREVTSGNHHYSGKI